MGTLLLVALVGLNLVLLALVFQVLKRASGAALQAEALPVSYTHLTLPTICSV